MGTFMLFTNNILPEAICCCLCDVVDIVLHMCTHFHGHLY